LGRVAHSSLCISLVGVWALTGCEVYDARKIEPMASAGSGAMPMDSGTPVGGGAPDEDGGEVDSGSCLERRDELCNLLDDDCDGHIDEDTGGVCAASFPNVAVAECVELRGEARCVNRECQQGFDNCDGLPSNGCEPFCMCNECPDEDAGAGSDVDGGE
jgi:hypothetical protein